MTYHIFRTLNSAMKELVGAMPHSEENKNSWERRRQAQEEDLEMNNMYEEWMNKDRETQILELQTEKEAEDTLGDKEARRKEKAKLRKRMWKNWRSQDQEEESTLAEDEEVDLPGEEERDSPGQGNSLHISKEFPEK